MTQQVVYQFVDSTLFPDRIAAVATLWIDTPDGPRPTEMIGVYGKRGEDSEQDLLREVSRRAIAKWLSS